MPAFAPAPLCFVTGKGGTGKTTLTATLATYLARKKRRVAVIEFERADLPPLLDGADNPQHINLTPREAFAEYAIERLGSAALYRTVFDNRFVHYFLDATPGLNDLACLGKLWKLHTSGDFDHCLVDLPATGHGLSVLRVPRLITDTIHFGPLHEHGQRMLAMLRDAAQTSVYAVATPEELPITEAELIADTVAGALQMRFGGFFVNRVLADPLPQPHATAYAAWATKTTASDPYRRTADYAQQRYARQQELLRTLGTRKAPMWRIPDIAAVDPEDLLDATLAAWTAEVQP